MEVAVSIAPVPTDLDRAGRELGTFGERRKLECRVLIAATEWVDDPDCSERRTELVDAVEALSALSQQSLADKLGRRPTPTAASLADGGER
jgi:hypothetical protein